MAERLGRREAAGGEQFRMKATEEEPNRFDAITCAISNGPIKSGPKFGRNKFACVNHYPISCLYLQSSVP